jgi:hypothetical protein
MSTSMQHPDPCSGAPHTSADVSTMKKPMPPAPPLNQRAGGEGQLVAHMHQWPGLPA